MKKFIKIMSIPLAVALVVGCSQPLPHETKFNSVSPITLYTSNDIITMADTEIHGINAIAVQDGKILDLGQKEELVGKYSDLKGFSLDRRFEEKVITPGFVEPHIHLWMMGLLLGTDLITPDSWELPWGEVKGVQGHDDYVQRLKEVESETPAGEPLVTWGYHHYFHENKMSRELLNSISTERPIIVWHRSFHELFFNDFAIDILGWDEESWTGEGAAYEHLNWARGHAYENGAKLLLEDVINFFIKKGFFEKGMLRSKLYTHIGGITTAIDPGVIATPEMFEMVAKTLEDGGSPLDYWLMPAGNFTYSAARFDADKGKAIAEGQMQHASYQGQQVQWLPKFVKLFSDGAAYSQLMQLKDGYIDGHEGEWLQTPAELEDSMRPYWKDGYTIVIHANGDHGFESTLSILEKLNSEHPRTDHRTGLHHLAITAKDDIPRAVQAGANFSVNPYYLHVLGELYGEQGVGKERAEVMSRGRSFIDAGGKLSLHSDSPMAPAQPLSLVWAAVNRIGLSGETVLGAQEKITVDEAMRAITIDAAYTARLEGSVGSIEIGKNADFTILDASPYKVATTDIKDIAVIATVYRGVPAPIHSEHTGMVMSEENMQIVHALNGEHHHEHDICSTNLQLQQAFMPMNNTLQ